MEYPKIETLFNRKEDFTVNTDLIRKPVYTTINKWDVTEKVDGTNIRVLMDTDGNVSFNGRTNNAQIPGDLIKYLIDTFTVSKMRAAFEPFTKVVLYGEGYGAGIQKIGKEYRSDKSFRLFDVLIDDRWWLDWENTCDVANKLGIKTVPYLGQWTLNEIINTVRTGIQSITAIEDSGNGGLISEGIVGRPIETLFDKNGNRVILKLKTCDFTGKKN